MITVLPLLSGCEKSDFFSIEETNFSPIFEEGATYSKDEVNHFVDSFFLDLDETMTLCDNDSEIWNQVITREETEESFKRRCDTKSPSAYSFKVQLKLILEIFLRDIETITVGKKVAYNSRINIYEMNENSFRFTTYDLDNNYSQYLMAYIDGEMYYQQYEYGQDSQEKHSYRHLVFYENNYHINKYLGSFSHYQYEENYKNGDFYMYDLRFCGTDNANEVLSRNFVSGSTQTNNSLYFVEDELVSHSISYYDDNRITLNYHERYDDNECQVLFVNGFNLPSWTELHKHPTSYGFYEFYNGDEKLYDGYKANLGFMIPYPQVFIENYNLTGEEFVLGEYSISSNIMNQVKTSFEASTCNYQNDMERFNIKFDAITYEEREDDYFYIKEYIRNFLNK